MAQAATKATTTTTLHAGTKKIKQEELQAYRDKILERDTLKSRLETVENDLEARSMLLCHKAKMGMPIERGGLTGGIKVTAGRRSPKYKDWIIANHGEKQVQEILNDTPKSDDKENFEVMVRITD